MGTLMKNRQVVGGTPVVDTALDSQSTDVVQNKVVAEAISTINSTLTNHHETDLNDKSSDVNYHSCDIDYDETMIRIYAHISTSSTATRIVLGSLPVNPRTRSEYPLACNVASGQYASATNASVWVDGNGRLVLYKTASAVDLYIAATIKRI